MRIPLSAPDITEPEIEAVAAVLRTPNLSLGPKLEEFESALKSLTGSPHALAVSSGTAGLHLAMCALDISEGDEVIVPSFTFIAAANAIRYVGATPVFVDIDAYTLNLSPEAVAHAITLRTRAILVVHTFGRPADMAPIQALARKHNLKIIEDACEAIGATYQNRPAGTLGDIGVFAFYPNKQITTGEGGAVLTANPALAATIRSLRNQGRRPSDAWLQHTDLGFNYRLSDIACTLGIGQLHRLAEILARREQVAHLYDRHLAHNPNLILPALDPIETCTRTSWFVYVVRLTSNFSVEDRDAIAHHLQQSGIACGRYFAPIHLQPAYTDFRNTHLPITESEAFRTLALPFFNRLSEAEIAEVAATLEAAIQMRPARTATTSW